MAGATELKEQFDPEEHQHTRYNPLRGTWVLVCPHRAKRPWTGQVEKVKEEDIPPRDPKNPLCPGSKRMNGEINPEYENIFTFENDFPALLCEGPRPGQNDHPLLQYGPAGGTCRVICFHPRTDLTLALMDTSDIRKVIDEWVHQLEDLGTNKNHVWVQIFENKGKLVGCSNPHPHCQVWACDFMPNYPRMSDEHQLAYYRQHGRPMLTDYVALELERKERIVLENQDWLVVVPFWAYWPFETLLVAKRHVLRLSDLTDGERNSLAEILKKIVVKYDNLFECNFPYMFGWHGAPTGPRLKEDNSHWQLHGMFFPPLLRSATVQKFMGTFEQLAQEQRDLTPERAAARLRALDDVHYKTRKL